MLMRFLFHPVTSFKDSFVSGTKVPPPPSHYYCCYYCAAPIQSNNTPSGLWFGLCHSVSTMAGHIHVLKTTISATAPTTNIFAIYATICCTIYQNGSECNSDLLYMTLFLQSYVLTWWLLYSVSHSLGDSLLAPFLDLPRHI